MIKDEDKKLMDELEAKFEELFSSIDEDELDDLDDIDELDNTIVLNDENGKEVKFEFLDLVEYEDEEYVVLLPVEDSDDSGEVVILRLEESDNDENESYASVEDEKVLAAVFEIFKEKFKSEFNFLDS